MPATTARLPAYSGAEATDNRVRATRGGAGSQGLVDGVVTSLGRIRRVRHLRT
jgi:hypothetical protein